EEAWNDPQSPKSATTGRTVRDDCPDLNALRRGLPALVLRHNLHGVDIDPRCAQIAQLALWMRAQRAYNDFGMARGERLPIARTNIVVAEPMPGERELREEFVTSVDKDLGQLVDRVFDKMTLAGDAGSLLKIEEEIPEAVREVYGEHGPLFQKSDEECWREAENKLLYALKNYAQRSQANHAFHRRLFAEDAARGLAFINLCRQKYDVCLANPPFGEASEGSKEYVARQFGTTKHDLACTFAERCTSLVYDGGHVGHLTTRTWMFRQDGEQVA
ncbi:MAG: Eco57I restriction-modification methylase domain-containing protein, partial [Gammaproteobacteria bacterium]